MRISSLLFLLFLCTKITFGQQLAPYKNPKLPIPERVQDLLSRMTPEEKFWQLFMIPGDLDKATKDQYSHGIFGFQVSAASKGDAGGQLLTYNTSENAVALTRKINAIQKYFVEESRLGIPVIAFDEALHGLVRDGATAFPQSIALAATWDTAVMRKVASAIATETKARGIRDILSPVVNIASDVRWGRTEETYGEDPFLTSEMGVAFVKSFEHMGIITTPKHFLANVGDGGRDSYPIHWNERLLDEIYLVPFKACIERGGSRSVMTAYNSLDGHSCSTNHWLLTDKLKDDWGFKGFVISDANAVGGDVVLHYTAKTYADAGKNAINNGLDVIFQTDYQHHKLFIAPFLNGEANQKRIDDAVSRVLTAKFELGLFENPYVSEELIQQLQRENRHKAIAREAALKSMVLLKNNNNVLPLPQKIKRIAVIGEEATAGRLGGYSGKGNGTISILKGIEKRAGNITVNYSPGAGIQSESWTVVPSKFLSSLNGPGLKGEYFNNVVLEGKPVMSRTDPELNFSWTLFSPGEPVNLDFYSVRWTGQIVSPETGNFSIGLDGNDGYRLFINNQLVVDRWQKQSYSTQMARWHFEENKKYDLRVEFYEPVGNAKIRLIWTVGQNNNWRQQISKAVAVARQSDVAIITAGIHEGEFQDRAFLSLPGHQEELIEAIAATGKPVIVVLTGGSAITMNKWINKVDGIIDSWYSGEEGGNALAAILFGDYNPAGRLPITFPQHEAQLPLVYNHKSTGRGDDYYNLSGLPLFPFGYGLSYTSFIYSQIELSQNNIRKGSTTTVSCLVRNSGKQAGEEVVQLYIRDLLASISRPVMELKGFQRVSLKPGEEKKISFEITPEMLRMLDNLLKETEEAGDFRIMIGASSRDIRLKETLTVKE
ncbi:glycoside hydrolase family 3 C-terminal domain-containing protein [Flavihumibacter profundi]|uniref:glycoside hydrolase family 3 C-terminal domain-containing protein n=1 Tax=Flavihumibacter profundi TaxID=2716883 RepID=UPI001CC6028A|nr:glycoside hydrolase family 3 C-terminal domain-containing protein [Flavihumibacter profundi]MBZ5856760.1 glycoside hydrolase family 3 C-terminal domain-containing protein [Flavihumibacter profundi]